MPLIALLVFGLALTSPPAVAADQSSVPDALVADQSSAPDIAPAQQSQKQTDKGEAKEPPTPPHTGVHALLRGLGDDMRHLPSKDNLYIALAGGAGALAVHPVDRDFNARLRSHYDEVNTAFAPGKWVGQSPVQIGAALAVYSVGRFDDQPKVSHLGMDLLRAQIIDEALTEAIKLSTRRERPDGSNRQSFPSGHASMTFATATVIERHLGWRYSFLGYTIASYVSASRLHDNRHYLSDVVFGAALGTISGRTVTQHGRNVWTLMPARVPGGAAVLVTRTY